MSTQTRTVEVPGGWVVQCNIFDPLWLPREGFSVAIADPPYGDGIVAEKWDQVSAKELAQHLASMAAKLAQKGLPGSHLWLWGGIGTPGERALYRALIEIEDVGDWLMAEQITWRKKRGYGTEWRCLMTREECLHFTLAEREECLRFVLGDVKKPRVYHKQFTDEVRGYEGFNEKYKAKSDFKRLTMVWDHASDMGQNKPHKCHKPRELAETQILSTTDEGDLVLDLFAGSAEVSLVARECDRRFVAYEGDSVEFDKIVARLS